MFRCRLYKSLLLEVCRATWRAKASRKCVWDDSWHNSNLQDIVYGEYMPPNHLEMRERRYLNMVDICCIQHHKTRSEHVLSKITTVCSPCPLVNTITQWCDTRSEAHPHDKSFFVCVVLTRRSPLHYRQRPFDKTGNLAATPQREVWAKWLKKT